MIFRTLPGTTVRAVSGPLRMVLLTTCATFEAQVLAARLGAEGIVWQLRSNLGGPHPLGPVDVLVDGDDLATAQELLDPEGGSRVDDGS